MTKLISNRAIPIGRSIFIPRSNLKKEQLHVEANGEVDIRERDEFFIVRNLECCRSVIVSVSVKEEK